MQFSRVFLSRLQNQPDPSDIVVVVDVLRSFTTAAVALDRGATPFIRRPVSPRR
jgi:2-phosphosulfolactate phosphatase